MELEVSFQMLVHGTGRSRLFHPGDQIIHPSNNLGCNVLHGQLASQQFQVRAPSPLFQTPPGPILGDVTADGKRFLLVTPVGPNRASGSVPRAMVRMPLPAP